MQGFGNWYKRKTLITRLSSMNRCLVNVFRVLQQRSSLTAHPPSSLTVVLLRNILYIHYLFLLCAHCNGGLGTT